MSIVMCSAGLSFLHGRLKQEFVVEKTMRTVILAAALAMGVGTAFAQGYANRSQAAQQPTRSDPPAQYTYNYGATSAGQTPYAQQQPGMTLDTQHGQETALPPVYGDDSGSAP
jgi:hypothetical protein